MKGTLIVNIKYMVRVLNGLLIWHWLSFLIPPQDHAIIVDDKIGFEAWILLQALHNLIDLICIF